MERLRVVVVDDHQLVLEAVRAALADDGGIEVVGESRFGAEAAALVARTSPDVALLDVNLPDLDGIECLAQIKERSPRVKVVLLSGSEDPAVVRDALERGASAFVLKQIDPRDLAGTLRQVVEGTVFTHSLASGEERRGHAARDAGLTPRQTEILGALATGKTNKLIAYQFGVGEQAVKEHLTNLYRKLGADNRVSALRLATERGLVDRRAPANGGRRAARTALRVERANPRTRVLARRKPAAPRRPNDRGNSLREPDATDAQKGANSPRGAASARLTV